MLLFNTSVSSFGNFDVNTVYSVAIKKKKEKQKSQRFFLHISTTIFLIENDNSLN